jgi:hypothetical protein
MAPGLNRWPSIWIGDRYFTFLQKGLCSILNLTRSTRQSWYKKKNHPRNPKRSPAPPLPPTGGGSAPLQIPATYRPAPPPTATSAPPPPSPTPPRQIPPLTGDASSRPARGRPAPATPDLARHRRRRSTVSFSGRRPSDDDGRIYSDDRRRRWRRCISGRIWPELLFSFFFFLFLGSISSILLDLVCYVCGFTKNFA